MIAYSDGTLHASIYCMPTVNQASQSLRIRRLFYVGKCAIVGITGVLPNYDDLTNIVKNLALYVMTYEQTGKFEIPKEVSENHSWFRGNDRAYVIMTKEGLYTLNDDTFKVMDDQAVHAFGFQSGLFHLTYQHYGDMVQTLDKMSEYDNYVTHKRLVMNRTKLGKRYVADDVRFDSTIKRRTV